MNIYIPIEIKLRELEGRALLAAVAAERGHTVILGGKEDTMVLANNGKLPPGIVHHKGVVATPQIVQTLHVLNKHNYLITCQDEEHGLLEKTFTRFAKKRFSDQTLSKMALYFCWGKYDQDCLKELYRKQEKKIILSGSPRVDLWREDFSAYFTQSNISYFKHGNPFTPYILIASNMGTFLNENRFWDIIHLQRESGSFFNKPGEEFIWYEKNSYETQLIKMFVQMIRALSKTYPNYNIVVRPHPVDSIDAWIKLVGDYPNVIISREGTISTWIRNATVLIHNGCTSAFEAAACKLPRIAYRPLPSELEREIPNRLSYQAFSLEDLINAVSTVVRGNNLPGFEEIDKTTKQVLNNRFTNLQGELAADTIVDKWEEIGSDIECHSLSAGKLYALYLNNRIKVEAKRIASELAEKTFLKKPKQEGFSSKHKYPHLEQWEIKQIVDNLQRSTNRFHRVNFKRIGRRTFMLYSEQ